MISTAPQQPANRAVGIDVSFWQERFVSPMPSWVSFAICKCTEANFKDKRYSEFMAFLSAAERVRGAYHLIDFQKSAPVNQAELYLQTSKLSDGDLPPFLDIEPVMVDAARSGSRAFEWCMIWLRHVERQTGRKPIVYTSLDTLNRFRYDVSEFSNYPLWLVEYWRSEPVDRAPTTLVDMPWKDWLFWQFTSDGPGKSVAKSQGLDLNYFNGTPAQLRAFATQGTAPVKPKEEVVDIAAALAYNNGRSYSLEDTFKIFKATGANPWDDAQSIEAICNFQRSAGIEVDGKVGPATFAAILKAQKS